MAFSAGPLFVLSVAAAGCFAVAGCNQTVAGGGNDGAAIFAEACARCHGTAGVPSEQLRKGLGVKDLTARDFRSAATVVSVAARVREGSESKIMPAFESILAPAQIEAVATYVLTLPLSAEGLEP